MLKFEVGKKYSSRAICNYNCIFEIEVTKRTAKSIAYKYEGKDRRSKINYDSDGNEYIVPDRYSMAPSFHA